MSDDFKVLQVTAADVTAKKLLLPLIERLAAGKYRVEIACSDGPCVPELRALGYVVHTVTIERRISPLSNLRSLWNLYRLMKKERFDIVHVHTPVAAALGRVAAWLAGVPVVIYTAHGFYFHDNMKAWARGTIVSVEKLLGRMTDLVFTQSHEDAVTAVKEAICPLDRVLWIGNGVDTARFTAEIHPNGARKSLGLGNRDKVVGFVGRLVGEKGILELVQGMKLVVKAIPDAKLLIVGGTLDSDRDRNIRREISRLLKDDDLASHVVFAGFIEDISRVMAVIDVFVLPSYREGMPRTIIEAMACGKPVVATDIRGCREEVVPGCTGLLVPVKDPVALAEAIIRVLSEPDLAQRMGFEGRLRACDEFDERFVLDRQLQAYGEIVGKKLACGPMEEPAIARKRAQTWLKRAADIALSSLSLTVLAVPFLAIAALIKLESPGPVFFRQERIGRDGIPFQIWKFRTMEKDAIKHGLGLNVARDDSRITRVGNVLRGFGLDELAQLFNVLKGEMSIVGPRPTLRCQVEHYDGFQRRRLQVRPGITSLAVVNGRNLLSWKERINLDVTYVNRWSLLLDAKIIFRTFWAVLVTRTGIYGADGINDDFISNRDAQARERELIKTK